MGNIKKMNLPFEFFGEKIQNYDKCKKSGLENNKSSAQPNQADINGKIRGPEMIQVRKSF